MRARSPGPLSSVRAAALALLLGCSSTSSPAPPIPLLSPTAVEEPVSTALTGALAADARGESADSLWDRDATVIVDGELRSGPPRFAGVGASGEVAVTSSRLEVRQSLVWVYLEYRWLSLQNGAAQEGKATVLLTPRPDGGGWRIVHAHSSTNGKE